MVTKDDLTRYTEAIERSSARVYEVLKDVAVQFSDIAKQLELLARQFEESRRDNQLAHKEIDGALDDHEKTSAERAQALAKNAEIAAANAEAAREAIEPLTSVKDVVLSSQAATRDAILGNQREFAKAMTDGFSRIELALVRSRTLIVIICGTITAVAAVAIALVK